MQLLRVVLVWLLVLAMPVQGATAAVMGSCGPSGAPDFSAWLAESGAAAPSQAMAAHAIGATDHDHPGHHHDHHDHPAAVDPTAAPAADGDVDQPPDHPGHSTHKKCSACASCCSMSALPSPASALPVPDFAPTVFFCDVPRVVAFAAEGPERPPRSHLA